MDLIVNNLRIPVEKDGAGEYVKAAARKLGIGAEGVTFVKTLSKALDARAKHQFYYEMSVVVRVPGGFTNRDNIPAYTEPVQPAKTPVHLKEKPIIIGMGPAGLFAALELLEYGIQPILFERGKKIEDRHADIQNFIRERKLDEESNIQFGEGGAGSYSDGKLFSRIKNSGHANKVLDTFIKFGAPEEIGYMSKPHVGTDVLCRIVKNMRDHILEQGGEIFYSSKMTDLLVSDGKAVGVVINGEKEFRSSMIYLAVGHSARDTFEMLHKKGITLEQKPIAVGMRIEHPVEVINRLRYGKKYMNDPSIGAANYSFTHTDRKKGRGVYTFCMCPGGEVVNASSEQGMLVVNGMSYSKRDSAFSNSAIVVSTHTADYGSAHPLAGLEFQREIERKAFRAAGGTWESPAQNLLDFLKGAPSAKLNPNSFKMGTVPVPMEDLFPKFVSESLKDAFKIWERDYPLFVSEHAILLGAETRTSCPVRMTRSEQYESVNIKNLYPIGEGAGYAGGITSSATDAIKAVEGSMAVVGREGIL